MNITIQDQTSSLNIQLRKKRSVRSILAKARRLCLPPVIIFGVAFLSYLALGYWLTFRSHAVVGDAWSRVALANQVLTSRDPSLADIGFVWSPLPTLALIPLVSLARWIPSLVSLGFASVVFSAACMAGAVGVFERIASDVGVRPKTRTLIVSLFALSPMTLLYAANGMSEAAEVLALLLALRPLMKWLHERETRHLAAAGLYMALAYLTRYEPIASAAAVAALVALATLCRTPSRRAKKRDILATNVAVVSFLPAVAFVGWAGFSWLIVGSPFEQFSSAYGNATQVVPQAGEKGSLSFIIQQLMIVAPLLPLLLLTALPLAWRRHDWRPLGALSVLGAPVMFNAFGTYTGHTLGWLRFHIAAVPLAAVLAAWLLGTISASGSSRPPRKALQGLLAIAIVILTLASTATITIPNIQDWDLAMEEYGLMQAARGVEPRSNPLSQTTRLGERKIAAWLDDQNLPEGSVILDAFLGFPIQLYTDNPRQFVVNCDLDFQAAAADPVGFGAKYILVPSGGFLARLDAIARAHPRIYDHGAPFVELVREYKGPSLFDWKVYRVKNVSQQVRDDFLGSARVRSI